MLKTPLLTEIFYGFSKLVSEVIKELVRSHSIKFMSKRN